MLKRGYVKLVMALMALSLAGCTPRDKITGEIADSLTEAKKLPEEYEDENEEKEMIKKDNPIPFSYIPNEKEDGDEREIVCWGDSMTEGYGSTDGTVERNGIVYDISGLSYPEMLADLTGLHTFNFGVSGANSLEICMMQGAYPIDEENLQKITADGRSNRMRLSYVKEGREHPGDILILEIGSNGGWDDDYQVLIDQYKAMIEHSGCENYIVVGDTDDMGNSASTKVVEEEEASYSEENGYEAIYETSWDKALKEAFGEHFINIRAYILQNGMEMCHLTPTVEEEYQLSAGMIPDQLRSDWTHFTCYGYYVQAVGIYEKGVELGYWK
ncbi:MAG: SGNH/GDSL hydrolase family protein [Eubacterium sp.]|nr:SGNH/GDSL hydrolase family protein [Eubacterium sp.]